MVGLLLHMTFSHGAQAPFANILFVILYFYQKVCESLRLVPVKFKIVWGARYFALKSFAGLAFLRICDRRQEITSGLPWRTIPAHFFKIIFRYADGAKENLPPFVKNKCLVEYVEDRL